MRQNTWNYLFKTFIGALLTVIVSMSICAVSVKADGTPHTHDNITFDIPWNQPYFPIDTGNYYLTDDIQLVGAQASVGSTGNPVTVNICLNGHVIKGAEGAYIVINEGSALSIYDCNSDNCVHKFNSNDSAFWKLDETEGNRTVTGGAITGFSNKGVFEVGKKATLNIFGGNIVGNKSNDNNYGGAITLGGVDNNTTYPTLNMTGGNIIGNAAVTSSQGGAVYIRFYGAFNFVDGMIGYNYSDSNGGGIYSNKGTINMSGGTIAYNRATSNGGGIYNNSGSLTLEEGSICDNAATGAKGGGVYNNSGSLRMTGGIISNNTAVSNQGGGIYNRNEISLTGGEITGNKAQVYGAGISCEVNSTTYIGGTVKIYDNENLDDSQKLTQSNIHLINNSGNDAVITLLTGDEALKEGADVRVTVYLKAYYNWKTGYDIGDYFSNLSEENCKYISMTNSATVEENVVDNTLYRVHKDNDQFVLFDPVIEYQIIPYEDQGHTIYVYKNVSDTTVIEKSKSGETVYLKITPNSGYSFDPDTVMAYHDGGPCPVTFVSDGVYSFVMPTANVRLTADFSRNTSSVSQAPSARDSLQYTGEEMELITAGTAVNGTMVYCLGEDSINPPSEDAQWSEELPKGTNAGDYYIWYKSKGNDGYADSTVSSDCRVVVNIEKADYADEDYINGLLNNLQAVKPSKYGASDGKITGTNEDMLYTTQNNSTSEYNMVAHGIRCTASETTGLPAGTYYVFIYPESGNYYQSRYVTIVIPEGNRPVIPYYIPTYPDNDSSGTGAENNPSGDATDSSSSSAKDSGNTSGAEGDSSSSVAKDGGNTSGAETDSSFSGTGTDIKDIIYANENTMNSEIEIGQKGKKIVVSWGRVEDVDGYMIYGGYCGRRAKLLKTVKGNDKTAVSFKKLNDKAIDFSKTFKFYVVAYRNVDKEKEPVGKSLVLYFAGEKNAVYSNVVEIKPSKESLSVKKGKSKSIKAELVLDDDSKKIFDKGSTPALRYMSSDKSIATVTSKGKIKAHAKGTCIIYMFSPNGCCAQTEITVK